MANEHEVFVDANVFVALLNRDGALHQRAVALWSRLKEEGAKIVTSNMVVSEVITVLSQRAGKSLAVEFASTMYESPERDAKILYSDVATERRAVQILRSIHTKNVSFVDAVILATMERAGMRRLASFDGLFRRQNGIELLV